jgi:hypothetical protein
MVISQGIVKGRRGNIRMVIEVEVEVIKGRALM